MSLTAVRPNARPDTTPVSAPDTSVAAPKRPAVLLVLVLAALSAIGPLATDLYLPALPEIAGDLGSSESRVKLTLTAVMAGLALGQLVAGPLSDRWGRRLPLLVGTGVFTVVTFAIMFVDSAETFMVLRFLQGLAAAAGLVVSRAVVRDVFHGDTAATFFSRLMLITGLAPMLGPLLGGQLLYLGPWQLIFGALGLAGAATFALVYTVLPESLPEERRSRQDPRVLAGTFLRLLRDPGFMAPTAVLALSFGMSFTYISAFSFVSQNQFDATAQQFSLVFGVTTLGMILGNQVNVALIRRMELRRRLAVGLVGAIASVLVMVLLAASGRADLVNVTAALFVMMLFTGLISPNATAMALSGQPAEIAGTSSALLGTLQFAVGSGLAATAGLTGTATLGSMATVMLLTAVGALAVFLYAARRAPAPAV
ncbi:multidrug effflux MFS transporter [Nocardiopsis sp. MG754419]|uniref:multidrug effflux MFS transporter n=1 Tax=Nocardiopsis sp. MG754419 TaxID=2259865 RepID=UPI001BAB7CA5|nr:multidrug effflux MFS transporter [Nocardiopsis sp. MG754419]MBR8742222.1 Bcr/CflA family drug resistance efflux transporter [Nocardiopsis sp. MG754419]